MKNLKIVFTWGSGRFGKIFKKTKSKHIIYFPTKSELNILNIASIENYITKKKPKIIIHAAALSRPMEIHQKKIDKSIDLNIIGTANVTKVCLKHNIKLIYFSTSYVYPGVRGNYKENDSLLPINYYAWSKLGGECSVMMYKNSLILRICMTEKPFIHKKTFFDLKTNFMYHDEVAKILPKLLFKKGIVNLGGPTQSVYDFAKKYNKKVKKISARKKWGKNAPLNPSMNLGKLNKFI